MNLKNLNEMKDKELEEMLNNTLEKIYTKKILEKMTKLTKVYLLGYSHGLGLITEDL